MDAIAGISARLHANIAKIKKGATQTAPQKHFNQQTMHCKDRQRKVKASAANGTYTKRPFQDTLNRYCRLVHAPNGKERLNVAKLNALRVAAAWRAIIQRPSIAPDLVVLAQIPTRNIPFTFTELDAFRMQVDALHMRGAK